MPTLNWIGKEAVVRHHAEVPFRLLEEVPALSCPDPAGDSENLIVQGDNLEALKALLPRYAGQVKCIYIDPPYNTGNEGWIYNDAVNSPEIRQWLGKTVGKEAEDLSRHDKWLCMMYPRLVLLRQFLRDDGAIFVSIDDNEVASLRLLMDEIFGKRNFLCSFVWNTEGHTDNQFHVKVHHEYLVSYARRASLVAIGDVVDPNTRDGSNLWKGFAENSITKNGPANPASEVTLPIGFPCSEESIDLPATKVPSGLLRDLKNDGLGSSQLKRKYPGISFPLRFDEMTVRHSRLTKPCRVFSGWANVNKLKAYIAARCEPISDGDNRLEFYLSENGVIYYRRARDSARNIVSVLRNLGTTEQMRSEIESMGLTFRYPKPKELLSYLIRVGAEEADALILDSFAGSGTTGHAVLALNQQDGGNRRFILCEIDQKIAADITRERVARVAQGYTNAKGEAVAGLGGGFQFARLGKTLFDESGMIRADVKFAELAEFVFFRETGRPLPRSGRGRRSPLLGTHDGRAVYLLFNGILADRSVDGGNVLTGPVLAELPPHAGPKVIYAAACRMGRARLEKEQITFKQTPYDLHVP